MKIFEITKEYKGLLDILDIEILIAFSLNKTKEFVLTHPEFSIAKARESKIKKFIERRIKGEPIAYILGHKEFYGLDFEVNKYTLVPRPETEILVEEVLDLLRSMLRSKLRNITIVDVGTGSGCIITSIAHVMRHGAWNNEQSKTCNYFATDISKEALKVAKKNARLHNLEKDIKFFHGSLLSPFTQDTRHEIQNTNLIITANLPYLSKNIYDSAPIDVKKYEPKSALYSAKDGLAHYEKLLNQLKKTLVTNQPVTVFLEISPEQKVPIQKLIKSIFLKAKIEIKKDLAGKWRLVKVTTN